MPNHSKRALRQPPQLHAGRHPAEEARPDRARGGCHRLGCGRCRPPGAAQGRGGARRRGHTSRRCRATGLGLGFPRFAGGVGVDGEALRTEVRSAHRDGAADRQQGGAFRTHSPTRSPATRPSSPTRDTGVPRRHAAQQRRAVPVPHHATHELPGGRGRDSSRRAHAHEDPVPELSQQPDRRRGARATTCRRWCAGAGSTTSCWCTTMPTAR